MLSHPSIRPAPRRRLSEERGGLLITALLLAVAIAIGLVGYLNLSRTSLKLAHRTFFANDAANLAEAGLEEAIYCYNQMGSGVAAATAWDGWTINGTNAMRSMTPFNRDQNAIGTVKVYVHGYDGSEAAPYVIAQTTITPFDGSAPIVKVVQIALKQNAASPINGIVGINGLTLKGSTFIDSFNSNPTKSPTGPWADYSSANARSNASVVVASGRISIGNGKIYGNLSLGKGVAPPPAKEVTGTIRTDFKGTFPLPVYPTAASVSQSYDLGKKLPATLPAAGDKPAADGRYYYFVSGGTIGSTTITTGKDVTIVGSDTDMSSGLTLQSRSTCIIYIDGPITLKKGNDINNGDRAGALQIFTSTKEDCSIGNKSQLVACLYAPNADLDAAGGSSGKSEDSRLIGSFVAKTITVSGNMDLHYDEALGPASASTGKPWELTSWFELQSGADRSAVGALTNNFLP